MDVNVDGQNIAVPDDATPEEIRAIIDAISSPSPATQAAGQGGEVAPVAPPVQTAVPAAAPEVAVAPETYDTNYNRDVAEAFRSTPEASIAAEAPIAAEASPVDAPIPDQDVPVTPVQTSTVDETNVDPMGGIAGPQTPAEPITEENKAKIDPDTLGNVPKWVSDAKNLYKGYYGKDFVGTDAEVAAWAYSSLVAFDAYYVQGAVDMVMLKDAPRPVMESFASLYDTYGKTSWTLEAAGQYTLGATVGDPLNWALLLGVGGTVLSGGVATPVTGPTVAAAGTAKAAQFATKQAFMSYLRKEFMKGAALGVIPAVAGNKNVQDLRTAAGRQEGYNYAEGAFVGTIGAAIGGTVNAGVAGTASVIRGRVGKAAADVADTPVTPEVQAIADEAARVAQSPNAPVPVEPPVSPVQPGTAPVAPDVPPAAVEPSVTPPEAVKPPIVTEVLPKALAGAKPRYNYGNKGFSVVFESDVEKALYITAQKKPSKSDGAYRAWLKGLGYTDEEIATLGAKVRDTIKQTAKTSTDEAITVGKVVERKAPTPTEVRLPETPSFDPVVRPAVEAPPRAPYADAPNATPTVQDFVAAIKAVVPDAVTKALPRSLADMASMAEQAVSSLASMGIRNLQDAIDVIPTLALTDEQTIMVKQAVMDLSETLTRNKLDLVAAERIASTPEAKAVINTALEKLEPAYKLLTELDTDISSPSGKALRIRVGKLNTGEMRGRTTETILEEQGIDPSKATLAERKAADFQWQQEMTRVAEDAKADPRTKALDAKIDAAQTKLDNATDPVEAQKALQDTLLLTDEREAIAELVAEELAAKRGFTKKVYEDYVVKSSRYLDTWVMNSLFSLSTLKNVLLGNVIATAIDPALRLVGSGAILQRSARARAVGEYVSWYQQRKMLGQMAATMFKYGDDFLSAEAGKGGIIYGANDLVNADQITFPGRVENITALVPFLKKGLNAIPGGRQINAFQFNTPITFFGKMIGSLDQVFRQGQYRSMAMGKIIQEAYEKGAENGLSGAKLSAYVSKEMETKLARYYKPVEGTDIVRYLRKQAYQRGYTGNEAVVWIQAEMSKNKQYFQMARDREGMDYINDLFLQGDYKDTLGGRLAATYERSLTQTPFARFMLGYFARTMLKGVSVGTKITPGLNALRPEVYQELSGAAGPDKQARMYGYLLLGQGILFSTAEGFKSGGFTGANDPDPQRRYRVDGFGIRDLDPFAMSAKLWINVLDNLYTYQYREMRGDFVGQEDTQRLISAANVATAGIAQTFRDYSLAAGPAKVVDAFKSVFADQTNPQTAIDALEKFGGEKLGTLIPATIGKSQFPEERVAPRTIEQSLLARTDPENRRIPRMYDDLGNVQKYSNPVLRTFGIDIVTDDDRVRMTSKQDVEIQAALDEVKAHTNDIGMFALKFKSNAEKLPFKGIDLRTVYHKENGVETNQTMYDRVMERWPKYVNKNALHNILVDGRKNLNITQAGEIAKNMIKNAQAIALEQVILEETNTEELKGTFQRAILMDMGVTDPAFSPLRR